MLSPQNAFFAVLMCVNTSLLLQTPLLFLPSRELTQHVVVSAPAPAPAPPPYSRRCCCLNVLHTGVAGGSIVQGVLRVGDEIEVRPGIVTKDGEGNVRVSEGGVGVAFCFV